MTTWFFGGHETLTNRGCEALLRGITTVVRKTDEQAVFLAPSFNVQGDAKRWPQSGDSGVRFVSAYRLPINVKVWARLQRKIPAVRKLWIPTPALPAQVVAEMGPVDACVMTGGDVISLDYGVPSLTRYLGQAEHFFARGTPVYLWAASVGPFSSAPEVERAVVRNLSRYTGISVRETATFEYLRSLGLRDVKLVADPAFVMQPEPWALDGVLPAEPGSGLLGFNISPLVYGILHQRSPAAAAAMEVAVIEFVRDVLERTDMGVVFVPHVDSIDGGPDNSDYQYMEKLISRADLPSTRVNLAPRDMNAARVKHLIAQCRYFMGARTHATIAAWSSRVPTCSLGYSIKARGLNRDLFGDERYVLDTKAISRQSLWDAFERLRTDEGTVHTLLESRLPEWRRRAFEAMPALSPG